MRRSFDARYGNFVLQEKRNLAMKRLGLGVCAVGAWLALTIGAASAAVFSGTYDTGGSFGSVTTPPGSTTGPWQLTSSDSTFSALRFLTNEHPTFGDVTNINVVFDSPELNALASQNPINDGAGGGAPRISVALDTNGDSAADGSLLIYLGSSPNFNDTPAGLNAFSGINLIGLNDAGRYDTSAFGGSPFTTYSSALALLGTATVQRLTLVLDSFGGADKTLNVTNIGGEFNGTGQAEVTPEPASMVVWSLLGLAAGGAAWRRRRR
jgi:hypothetical protein